MVMLYWLVDHGGKLFPENFNTLVSHRPLVFGFSNYLLSLVRLLYFIRVFHMPLAETLFLSDFSYETHTDLNCSLIYIPTLQFYFLATIY
jgi:hypothetical protein